jgi:multiple sugar transport system ATP-binding protein
MGAVSVRDVTVAFGAVRVFDGLSIDVEQGELLVLLGPSGCGKSTLLNAIAGLLEIETGQIWIGGRNITWAEPKDRGIAMVFQSYALYPRMNVRGNLSFGLRMAKTPRAEIERRVGEAAALLQIDQLLERRPDQLSGGQRQRVAIGRALVRDAAVFLFDEPLSNLDAQLRNELRDEIKRLHHRLASTTMIYVTHDQIEAMTLADRIAVMKDQRIQQLGSPLDIYYRPANRFVAGFVGSPRMNFVDGRIESRSASGRNTSRSMAPAIGPASRSTWSSRSAPTASCGAPTAASRSRCARAASARSGRARRSPSASTPGASPSSRPMAARGFERAVCPARATASAPNPPLRSGPRLQSGAGKPAL